MRQFGTLRLTTPCCVLFQINWVVLLYGCAIAILFVLPWFDSSVRSMRYKGIISRIAILVFVASFIILGYLGVKAPTDSYAAGTNLYGSLLWILYRIFFWTRYERTKPEPDRITMDGGMGFWKSMGVLSVILLMVVLPLKAVGARVESPVAPLTVILSKPTLLIMPHCKVGPHWQ